MENKKIKSCAFTGHRAEKLPWRYNETDARCIALKKQIYDVLLTLYNEGCRYFLCGMASGCDLYFGEAVVALRAEKGDISLEGAVPFEGQSDKWAPDLRRRYFRLAEECDKLTVLRHVYTPDCMMERNRYMVDHADILLAAYSGESGGTQATILYAMRKNKQVIQLNIT